MRPRQNSNDEILKTLKNAAAFPVWVENVDGGGSITTTGGGSAGSGSVGKLVGKALSDTLGWRVRPNDPKGFLAALNNSFQLEEKQGVVLSKWTPHNYAIQADLGKITGPQASLAARGKVIIDNALPLLEGFTPLRPDSDPEDCLALTTLVASSLQKINIELWRVGGPVVQRVDRLFEILFNLGTQAFAPISQDPETVQGQLGALRDSFGYGFRGGFSNTVDDDHKVTNFIIFINYIDMFRINWGTQRQYFLGNNQNFFGSQLVLLSRDLDTIVEGVEEVIVAMDSVLLGVSERQSLRIGLVNDAPFTLAMMLEAIEEFGTTEGKFILQYGGKDGVQSTFLPLLENLNDMLDKVINLEEDHSFRNSNDMLDKVVILEGDHSLRKSKIKLPAGFYTPRVQITLQNLSDYLQQTREDADDIKRNPVQFVDRQELIDVVDGLNTTVKNLELQIKSLTPGAESKNPEAVGLQVLGEILVGESEKFEFTIPGASETPAPKLSGSHPGIRVSHHFIKLDNDGFKVSLTIKVSRNAQPGSYQVLVSYTDVNGDPATKQVQFNVV